MRRVLILIVVIIAAPFVPTGATAHAARDFTLSADFVGLYPDADVDIPVTVHNPQTYPIAVQSASVTIGDASPTCTNANVTAQSFSGDVHVPAGDDATFPLRMHMLASAPDACQGASFPLTFTATGASLTGSATTNTHSNTGGFAFTGTNPLPLAIAGATALTIGTLLVRRRRRPSREVGP